MSISVRYCGRDFSEDDLLVICSLAAALPTRRAIADAVCDALGWYRPDGRKKDMSARVALLRMAEDGLVRLPPPRHASSNGHTPRFATPAPTLVSALKTTLGSLGDIELTRVDTKATSRYWRELIASYHYLGYTPFAGAQLRYLIESGRGTLGALGFASSAWKCADRDTYIGWDAATREARLHLVVGNARFLILPTVEVPNLASYVLGKATRRLATDWQTTYGYGPVLVETFVETGRFHATSYKAANWIHVGQTKGRGKLDRTHSHPLPVKDIYLYPLRSDYRRILTSPA